MKTCIISLGVNETKKDCIQGLDRLEKSLGQIGFKGDSMFWRGIYPENCPRHLESPFTFKPLCIMEAKNKGYDLILWVDCAIAAIKPVEAFFRTIEHEGYLIFRNESWFMGEWCSDEALKLYGLSREEALKIPEIDASVIGLNMKNDTAVEFLNQWYEKARDGVSFRGTKEKILSPEDYEANCWNKNKLVSSDPRVFGHRHDQTAAGIIAHRLGMKISCVRYKDTFFAHLRNVTISINPVLVTIHYYPLMALLMRVKRFLGRIIRSILRKKYP